MRVDRTGIRRANDCLVGEEGTGTQSRGEEVGSAHALDVSGLAAAG
jgi:hypothetical protein